MTINEEPLRNPTVSPLLQLIFSVCFFPFTQSLPRVIPLNVGGYHFVTTLSTLTKDKDSMLAAMFSGRHELDTDSEGRYFIDRDGTYFKEILNYLRDSTQLPSAERALEVSDGQIIL